MATDFKLKITDTCIIEILENTEKSKEGAGYVQLIEHLTSTHKALGLLTSTHKALGLLTSTTKKIKTKNQLISHTNKNKEYSAIWREIAIRASAFTFTLIFNRNWIALLMCFLSYCFKPTTL